MRWTNIATLLIIQSENFFNRRLLIFQKFSGDVSCSIMSMITNFARLGEWNIRLVYAAKVLNFKAVT